VRRSPPRSFHFDRRARQIIKANVGDPDELLDTKESADLYGNSPQWFQTARCDGYGPEPTRLGARRVFYKRRHHTEFLLGRLRALAAKRR
jgi:hypothetical protein